MKQTNFHMTSNPVESEPWVIAITGASGTVYARRLLEVLLENVPDIRLELVVSEAGLRVLREEEGISASVHSCRLRDLIGQDDSRVNMHSARDIGASIASGSYVTSGMVIVPCTMSTLGAIASGYSQNLVHRAADVVLKEGRKLVLVPRETPLSQIQLENMLKLSRLGVTMLPAMPGFYHQPQTVAELVDMLVMRIVDHMGFRVDCSRRWKVDIQEDSIWPVASVKQLRDVNEG